MKFGTDGIRGPAGQAPIDVSTAWAVGGAAARYAQALGGRRVVVGYDTRPSGPELADAVADGVVRIGGQCLEAGVVPTSAVALAVDAGLAEVGVMVTASHNPASDNGFKVVGARGRKLDDAGVAAVEAWLEEPLSRVEGGQRRRAHAPVQDVWRRAVQGAVGVPNALAGRRLAVDLANGAATIAVSWLAEALEADVVLLGTEGEINHGVGSEHLGHLADAVLREHAEAGIAVDGDADRCRLVDETGRPVPGDAVLWLLADAAKAFGIAVTVMSNRALERQLPGVTVVRTPVGDRHVREAMDREGFPVGGEESGHVLFGDLAAGDGLVAGIRALTAAFERAERISEAFGAFQPLPRALGKVRVGQRPPLDEVEPLQAARAEHLPALGPDGRIFLRYSGTEPVLRILVEGESEAAARAALAAVTAVAEETLA